MRRLVLLLYFMVISGSVFSYDQSENDEISGVWVVTEVLDFTPVTSKDAIRESHDVMGDELRIDAQNIRFRGVDCPSPFLVAHKEKTFRYFFTQYGGMNPVRLSLPLVVSVIDPRCQQPNSIGDIYLRDQQHLVFFWQDLFLEARRVATH